MDEIGKVYGLDELLRRLDRVPIGLAKYVARDALQAGGEIILEAAQQSAPRKTGELEEDLILEVHVSGDMRSNRVLVGPGYPGAAGLRTRKRGKYAGRTDSSTSPGVYGKFVETGHGMPGHSWRSRYGSAKQRRRKGIEIEFGSHDVAPHPWLKPAFDSVAEEAVRVLADHTREGLERIDKLIA